jgi:hypothetical protein
MDIKQIAAMLGSEQKQADPQKQAIIMALLNGARQNLNGPAMSPESRARLQAIETSRATSGRDGLPPEPVFNLDQFEGEMAPTGRQEFPSRDPIYAGPDDVYREPYGTHGPSSFAPGLMPLDPGGMGYGFANPTGQRLPPEPAFNRDQFSGEMAPGPQTMRRLNASLEQPVFAGPDDMYREPYGSFGPEGFGPGMMPLDVNGPGGFVNSPMPSMPDVPSRGEQRAVGNPADPAMMQKQSPLRQRRDAERAAQLAPLQQSYGSFVDEFPPVMLPALSGLPINDPQAAEILSGMTPEERQQFYSAAAYNLREYGGETATPLSSELRSWQSMGEQERADVLERAASFHGFRPPAEGGQREYQSAPGKGANAVEDALMKQSEEGAFELPAFNTTEGQVLGYTMRAAEANDILNQLEQQGTRWGQRAMGILPGNSENMLRDDEFQQYLNAEQNFLAGVLRRDTGAAITSEEFDLYRPMFFPQPGDGPGVIEQKRRMRETALAAMAAGTAEGFSLLPEPVRQLVQRGSAPPAPVDYSTMSDEELMRALQGGN